MRPADDEATLLYFVYSKPTRRWQGAKGALLPGAHAFQELYISLQIRAGGAGEIVGHAAALVGTEGQDDRFADHREAWADLAVTLKGLAAANTPAEAILAELAAGERQING